MPWTQPYRLAIPAALIPLGNKAASLFDPDSGGDKTFGEPNVPEGSPTHCMISTQLIEGYDLMLRSPRDPALWFGVLDQMADSRGREALTLVECEQMCDELLFDDECAALEPPE